MFGDADDEDLVEVEEDEEVEKECDRNRGTAPYLT